MSKTNYLFSVVILSHNTSKVLKNCLDSLYQFNTGISFETIVIDHNSQDDSVKMLTNFQKTHKNFTLVVKKDNPGFGAGCNRAAKIANGKFLVFLNSDTLFIDNVFSSLETKLPSDNNLGIYSLKLLNKDKSFQASGGSFPNLANLFLWQFGVDDIPFLGNIFSSFHPKETGSVYKKGPDWVTGAFMIIPKDVFEAVGGFDEKIFMYTEEMELAYRISKLGKRVVYDPSERIIHLGGASGGNYLALTSEVKNIIYFWHKHKPAWQLPIAKFFFTVGSLLRLLFFGIIRQNESSRKAYFECIKLRL